MSKWLRHARKLQDRFGKIKAHGLTKTSPYSAFYRYVLTNIKFAFNANIEHKWHYGLKLAIHKGDAGLIGNIYYGLYEYRESLFILHFLRQGDHFIDAGANLGHFSLLAAGAYKTRVTSIEALPQTARRFKENVVLNQLQKFITIHNCGISDKSGNLYFSTNKTVMNHVVTEQTNESIAIPVNTLDNLIQLDSITCLKMDVEGYEYNAFLGATALLKNELLKVVIVELNDSGKKFGINDSNVVQLLNSNGFNAYRYEPFERRLLPLDSYDKSQFNTIFLRDLEFVQDRIINAAMVDVLEHKL